MTILEKRQMSEEDIKLNFITPAIQKGWKDHITVETKITDGRINIRGNIIARNKPKYADYYTLMMRNRLLLLKQRIITTLFLKVCNKL